MKRAKLSRKILCMILTFLLMAGLCACGKKEPTWQEQYDLGMKYLNEKDYEEAVTAFQVAISIDPKQQPAYIGAADAYVGMAGSGDESVDVDKCYEAAEENYRKALDIDSETEEVYEKFANMYVEKGDTKKAEELIEEAKNKGKEGTWADDLLSKLDSQEPAQEEAGQQTRGLDDVPEREWKQAYLDYAKANEEDPSYTGSFYRLLDINGDTLPELYVDSNYYAGGAKLCSYINGQVVSISMDAQRMQYIEGKNLFMTADGRADSTSNVVYEIASTGIEQIADGECWVDNVDQIEYDENDNTIFDHFTWNGEEVDSQAAYDALLNSVFDKSQAVYAFNGLDYSNVYAYDSFKTVISNY